MARKHYEETEAQDIREKYMEYMRGEASKADWVSALKKMAEEATRLRITEIKKEIAEEDKSFRLAPTRVRDYQADELEQDQNYQATHSLEGRNLKAKLFFYIFGLLALALITTFVLVSTATVSPGARIAFQVICCLALILVIVVVCFTNKNSVSRFRLLQKIKYSIRSVWIAKSRSEPSGLTIRQELQEYFFSWIRPIVSSTENPRDYAERGRDEIRMTKEGV